ncbi:MAG: nuclease domain-containing protein, partial [Anaerolineae bacterium]
KVRFDPKSRPAEEEEDTYELDVAGGDVERIVKRADIYKMHTYRDALRTVRAAVALFPGSAGVGEFYERRTIYWPPGLDRGEMGGRGSNSSCPR